MTNEERVQKFKDLNIAINCKTMKEARSFIKWCYDNDMIWFSSVEECTNYHYGENTCYYYSFHIEFADKKFYKMRGYKIIDYKDFMKEDENNMESKNKKTNLQWILENVAEEDIIIYSMCAIAFYCKYGEWCSDLSDSNICTMCKNCEFSKLTDILKFLNDENKSKVKLTKFEYDLLEMAKDTLGEDTSFSITVCYNMKSKKGYFKNVDSDMTLKEILENCEVVKNVD